MTTRRTPAPNDTLILGSMERLAAAGILDTAIHDQATGEGVLSFAPAYHQLLMAGRNPMDEPGFRDAWLTGDPMAVRRWIEREAACLPDPAQGKTGGRDR
jgi:hypothetical protein